MSGGLDAAGAMAWLTGFASKVAEQRGWLIDLDRPIGDADHGANLDRGGRAVVAALEATPPDNPGAAMKLAATTLIKTVGGASGPLYGTALLRAATAAGSERELDGRAVARVLEAALGGIRQRGKAEDGDKTMVDAWSPAVAAATEAGERGESAAAVARAAADAAESGFRATEPLVAHKGRASYLGERSAGHLDPGAASSAMLLECLAEVLERG